jgi:hypothetical protein
MRLSCEGDYFLQRLVEFKHDGVMPAQQIVKDWESLLTASRALPSELIKHLQDRSDFVGHGISVKKVLEDARIRIQPTFAEVFGDY